MIKYEKLWRLFGPKIVKIGKGSSLLFPPKGTEQGLSGFVEEKGRRNGELKGWVERQSGFHKTYFGRINATEQDNAKSYKVWRIFVAEVTKIRENLPQIGEIAENVTKSLHNINHKKP